MQQAVVEVLAADMRGERRNIVRLRDAAPSGGLILSVRRDPCGLRELLQFTKAGEELFVRESKYSFTLRRATDSEAKQPPSAKKRPRVRTAAEMGPNERNPKAVRRSVYDDLASSACSSVHWLPAFTTFMTNRAVVADGMGQSQRRTLGSLFTHPVRLDRVRRSVPLPRKKRNV